MKRILLFCICFCLALSITVCAEEMYDILSLPEIVMENVSYLFSDDEMMIDSNDGSIGGMEISANVMGPENVGTVLISLWGDDISEMPKDELNAEVFRLVNIWKDQLTFDKKLSFPYRLYTAHPVYEEDLGQKTEVLLIGMGTDATPVAYKILKGKIPKVAKEIISDPFATQENPQEAEAPEAPEKTIEVSVNGAILIFDQPPVAENGRVLVPLRAIFESLGADVNWIGETQTVTAAREDAEISLQLGSTDMYVNGNLKTLDVPAKALNGRTLVPVRAISEAFGCSVDWVQETQTVLINQ